MAFKSGKLEILAKVLDLIKQNPNISILDLGCGTGKQFASIIEQNPDLNYTGIEPREKDAKKANLKLAKYKNARIVADLAYEGLEYKKFDLVISLSVVEHVKQLKKFLEFSANKVKKGGKLIHIYDLGHALHSSSFLEKIQVLVCNNRFLRKFVPEVYIARYVDQKTVEKILKNNEIIIDEIRYYDNPGHITLLRLAKYDDVLCQKIINFENEVQKYLKRMPLLEREKLYPRTCIIGTKN